MTLALLSWFVVAPSLPGADADARLVATRLRPRVVRMLGAPVAVAAGCWLLGCLVGTGWVAAAAVAKAPTLAVLGPLSALAGAAAGGAVLVCLVLRERVWLEALGLPLDWRGPWLAGELAEHLGWDRRSVPVVLPSPTGPRPLVGGRSLTAPRPSAPRPSADPPAERRPAEPWALDTPIDRWAPDADEPTQWFDQGPSLAHLLADAKRRDEQAETHRVLVPRIPGVRYLDAARIRTPHLAEG